MAFFDLTALRAILATETDDGSYTNEELMSQIRENLEALLILLAGTNITGSATADPPNDTTGLLTDSACAWTDDDHNEKTLLITSGLAIGNLYTIDDTDDTNNRLVCTGDNLYSDGVRSADTYLILYDVKTNLDGHDHDGVNSRALNMVDHIHQYNGTFTNGGATYSDVSVGRLWLEAHRTTLHCSGTFYTTNAIYKAYVRLACGTATGTEAETNAVSGAPASFHITVDVSALAAGNTDFHLEYKNEDAGEDIAIQKLVFWIE